MEMGVVPPNSSNASSMVVILELKICNKAYKLRKSKLSKGTTYANHEPLVVCYCQPCTTHVALPFDNES